MMTNIELAEKTIEQLYARGVREFIVCAGARNAPLVKVLGGCEAPSPIQVYYFFEERSAAFFALGRMKATQRPVAVLTTSGTAVAELYPAVMEAFYSRLPLVVVTADRPKKFRQKGAPQSIEQVGVFSHYVLPENAVDWDESTLIFELPLSYESATQVNVCFREPLIDRAVDFQFSKKLEMISDPEETNRIEASLASSAFDRFFEKSKNPLVILGELSENANDDFVTLLEQLNQPIYAEAHSGLRQDSKLEGLRLQSGDRFLSSKKATQYFDGVIRIGSVPTVRLWRDLEDRLAHWPVISFSEKPFSGLSRVDEKPFTFGAQLSNLKSFVQKFRQAQPTQEGQHDSILAVDSEIYLKLNDLFEKYQLSEQTFFREISSSLTQPTRVFLGNSLPIREWDLAARYDNSRIQSVAGNRGVNGIDGLVSTFLGWSQMRSQNLLILGDLSALYDLAGLWPVAQGYTAPFKIIVINNSGGQIFRPMFKDAHFENHHELNFSNWAKMFHLNYSLVTETSALKTKLQSFDSASEIIEVQPNNDQTQEFWRAYDQLVAGLAT